MGFGEGIKVGFEVQEGVQLTSIKPEFPLPEINNLSLDLSLKRIFLLWVGQYRQGVRQSVKVTNAFNLNKPGSRGRSSSGDDGAANLVEDICWAKA